MKTPNIALRAVLVSALLSATTTTALADYFVTPLQGIEAGSTDSLPTAISATGTITGLSWTLDSYKAATWDNTGAVRELFPGAQEESLAYDINAANQVLLLGPRIWEDGVVTPIFVANQLVGNLKLNDSVQLALTGYVAVDGGNRLHALLVTNGATTDLGVLPGATTSWASDINNSGDVVGYSYTALSSPRATLWRNGSIVDLGALSGQTTSTAEDINDNGRVVGTSGGRLFTWENGVMSDLGTIAANTVMTARAINNNGDIVGQFAPSAGGAAKPFIWSNGVFTDLSAVLGFGGGCDAVDINDAGQIAVSCGYGVGAFRLTPAAPASDLSIAMSAGSFNQTVGNAFTYTLTISNIGTLSASNVTVNDTLPASLALVSATSSQGNCSGSMTITCNLNNLAAGANATVQITVTPTVAGSLTNSASVSGSEVENNTSNNSTYSVVSVSSPSADLGVTLSATPNPVKRNANLTYAISVKNSGPVGATGVVVTDTLPSSMSFVSASSSQGSCSGMTTVTCTLGSMTNGANANVTLVVKPRSTGTYTNKVNVSSSTTDSNTVNNNASVSVRVR
jgi:uncharacterized repeat protein (TIGR01451 family)